MQIEETEHALTELKHPSEYERELREAPIVNARQQKNIARLEILLERLIPSRDAIKPQTVEGNCWQSMIGLPGEDTGEHHPFKSVNESANKL